MWRRLLRIRWFPALVLSVPGIAALVWYAAGSWLVLFGYWEALGEEPPALSARWFHVAVHDRLTRDLRAVASRRTTYPKGIDLIELEVVPSQLPDLYAGAGRKSDRPYVKAQVVADGEKYRGRIRMRGAKPWHWFGRKKSLRVVLENGTYRGCSVFGLLVNTDPTVVAAEVMADFARDVGVLVPEHRLVRVTLNGRDMGVYHFVGQADASVFRRDRDVYGFLYSGNDKKRADPLALWRGPDRWKQVAAPKEGGAVGDGQLAAFLAAIAQGPVAFARYARRHVDLERFAAFEALDVLFGIDAHGFAENHKWAFDPYLQRWFPVAWALEGMGHEPQVNRAESPVTLALKALPEYRLYRDRLLWKWIGEKGRPDAIARRFAGYRDRLRRLVNADPTLEALDVLPEVRKGATDLLRPLTWRRVALAQSSEITTFARRNSFLAHQLAQGGAAARWVPAAQAKTALAEEGAEDRAEADSAWQVVGRVQLAVDAPAVRWEGVDVVWPQGAAPAWRVRDAAGAVLASGRGPVRFSSPHTVFGGAALTTASVEPAARVVRAPAQTVFVVEATARPQKVGAVWVRHAVTGRRMDAAAQPVPPRVQGRTWDAPPPPPKEPPVVWQGEVHLRTGVVIGENQELIVRPGTAVHLDGGYLVAYGPVRMEGTAQRPITVRGGGVALVGPGASGSAVRHAVFAELGAVDHDAGVYPAVINIHGAADVVFEDVQVRPAQVHKDGVHLAYAERFALRRVRVVGARADAVDAEFSSGVLDAVLLAEAADECLDLMGGRVVVQDSVFWRCSTAVSAGQRARVRLDDAVLASGKRGVVVKGGSRVSLAQVVLWQWDTGLEVRDRSAVYRKKARVAAWNTWVARTGTPLRRTGKDVLDTGYLHVGQRPSPVPPVFALWGIGDVDDLSTWRPGGGR